jgi:hypothetical protein
MRKWEFGMKKKRTSSLRHRNEEVKDKNRKIVQEFIIDIEFVLFHLGCKYLNDVMLLTKKKHFKKL